MDPTPAAAQPFRSKDGRWTIVFNGEIYNYRELRKRLEEEGYAFRTRCETEVLLYAFVAWGDACLPRLHGMFAFTIWDAQRETLTLARDRLGKKPLYYYLAPDKRLSFASELPALLRHPAIPRQRSLAAANCFLGYRLCADAPDAL